MSIEPMTSLSLLIQRLSAYPLKLFLYLCALAGSPDREVEIRFGQLSEVLERGETSVGKDMDEIRQKGMCIITTQANQYRLARVTIPREHWPAVLFEGGSSVPESSMRAPDLFLRRQVLAADGEDANSGVHQNPANMTAGDADNLHPPSRGGATQEEAFDRLSQFGIHPLTARAFIRTLRPERIVDTIEYIKFRLGVPRNRIHNPQGMLIHYLRESVPLPNSFMSARQLEAKRELERIRENERNRIQALECEYDEWCATKAESEIQKRYSDHELDRRLNDLGRSLCDEYPQIARSSITVQRNLARRRLLKEIRAEIEMPSFHEWCDQNGNFSGNEHK